MTLHEMASIARQIAEDAADLLRPALGRRAELAVKTSSIDLVTEFDQKADRLITSRLREAFPDHGLLAEESGEQGSLEGLHWMIDPLDGTVNFAHGIPHFGVSMSLYEGEQPRLAVTVDAVRSETYWAVEGGGAWLGERQLRVSTTQKLVSAVVATGFPYDRHTTRIDNFFELHAFLKRVQGVRRMGSATLDLAFVASGRYDGFWEYKLAPWDIAAGLLLVKEAGGRVSALDGSVLKLQPRNALLVSNGHLHEQMLEVLAQAENEDLRGPTSVS